MKQTSGTRYVPGYDLFKLIVAVILTIILIMLLLRENQRRFAALEMPMETEQAALPAMTSQAPLPTPSLSATPTENPITATSVATPMPTQTTLAVVVTPSPVPSSDPNECPSNPTRVEQGNTVIVKDWLNFRTGPGLNYPIQHTNRPGTELEVIGGPACTVKGDNPPRAYLWWSLRMKDGREGWSAEAPLNYPNYFLEPNP